MTYKHDHDKLIKNSNTGIEYEFAIAYLLMNPSQQTIFLNEVINHHQKTAKILDVIEAIDEKILLIGTQWKKLPDYYVSLKTTQDDTLGGPADVLLCSGKDTIHQGISIKFNNGNTWSPSGRHFLCDVTISNLMMEYRTHYIPLHLQHMGEEHGACTYLENSHRTTYDRKRSKITDLFIDKIRNEVILAWGEKSLEDKLEILKLGYHEYVDIDCSILTLKKNGTYKMEEMQMIPKTINDIELVKRNTSQIEFVVDGITMGIMQVKPNGGFIQRDGKRNSFVVGECNYGEGDLFGSWNFEVVKKVL